MIIESPNAFNRIYPQESIGGAAEDGSPPTSHLRPCVTVGGEARC